MTDYRKILRCIPDSQPLVRTIWRIIALLLVLASLLMTWGPATPGKSMIDLPRSYYHKLNSGLSVYLFHATQITSPFPLAFRSCRHGVGDRMDGLVAMKLKHVQRNKSLAIMKFAFF